MIHTPHPAPPKQARYQTARGPTGYTTLHYRGWPPEYPPDIMIVDTLNCHRVIHTEQIRPRNPLPPAQARTRHLLDRLNATQERNTNASR